MAAENHLRSVLLQATLLTAAGAEAITLSQTAIASGVTDHAHPIWGSGFITPLMHSHAVQFQVILANGLLSQHTAVSFR